MRTPFAFAVMLLFLAAGCSGPKPQFYWYRPGRTLEDAKADYSECKAKAQEEAAKVVEDEYFEGLRSPTDLAAGDDPQAKKKKSADPRRQARAEWGKLYQQNAFDGCMQSRGYIQLRPDQVAPDLKTRQLPLGGIAGR